MSWTRPPGPTLFSAALPRNMTGNRVSTVSSCRRRPPPKYTELWSPTSEELLSHLGHCWAKLAGAAPKGVIAPILRNACTCYCYQCLFLQIRWSRCLHKLQGTHLYNVHCTGKKKQLHKGQFQNVSFVKQISSVSCQYWKTVSSTAKDDCLTTKA